ncbi:prenyltransferase [Candidatus Saccharibacteria bacterium]|nr:prenyltransferase [Candidatus Saccharibacteria bacterium]NCU40331.1 prenyltransferase [Candidatus Saccharibacteria bacterium]
MQTIKLLFMTSRPISWVNTAYPFVLGYLMMGGGYDARFFIGALFFLIPYNLLMYGINDVFDYESDILNPRKGSVEGAVTPPKFHLRIILVSVGLCIPFVIALVALGNASSVVVLAAILFFVVAYSVKGLRFKEIPFIDSITSSIHFVGPLVYAYSLVGASNAGWLAALAFFFWGIASQAFGAVQDIVPDRKANIKSIGTVLGAARTVRFAFCMYIIATILVVSLGGGLALVVAMTALIYSINIISYLSISDKESYLARKGWKRFLSLNYFAGAVITICCLVVMI